MSDTDYRIVPEVGGFYSCGMDGSVREILEVKDLGGGDYAVLIREFETEHAHWQDANFWMETDTWGYHPASHRNHLSDWADIYPSLAE